MPFLPLFTGIRHLAHVLTVPPTKARLLCATPAGLVPIGTYRVQSPGFPKIVYLQDCFRLMSKIQFSIVVLGYILGLRSVLLSRF